MDRRTIHNLIIPSEGYAEIMESVVLPYLAERKTEKYCEREQGKKIFYLRCLADQPQGIVILSHGYTETADKHLENIYYFLRGDTMSSCRNTADTAAATGCAVIPGISLWYILMIIKDM